MFNCENWKKVEPFPNGHSETNEYADYVIIKLTYHEGFGFESKITARKGDSCCYDDLIHQFRYCIDYYQPFFQLKGWKDGQSKTFKAYWYVEWDCIGFYHVLEKIKRIK